MQTKQEVLQACTVNGLIVKLPDVQLERKLYMEVANALALIGGKWKGNKVMGFVFQTDPTELLQQIAGGEKRNLQKEYQYFSTPAKLGIQMAQLADIKSGESILEPEAGQGALIDQILKFSDSTNEIYFIEMMPTNVLILEKKYSGKENLYFIRPVDDDFLNYQGSTFDKIIANPPFAKNQDIDHIYKMYECLKPGGRIVTIASLHWQFAKEQKCLKFREWLDYLNAETIKVDAGEFKESGTNIATCILVIDKPL